MIYGYGIVDKNNNVYWEDMCVCEDRGPMEETCETLNDEDDPRAPYRVIQLQSPDALPSTGANMIADERQRQISEEGWTADHDDQHDNSELVLAAVAYALEMCSTSSFASQYWPWDEESYKPDHRNPIRNLVRAGAFLAAEIDRLMRIAPIEKT